VYLFLSASPRIWAKLTYVSDQQNLAVIKRLSETRWSAHADAVHAFRIGYQLNWGVLDEIIEDSSEKAETKAKVAGIIATCSKN